MLMRAVQMATPWMGKANKVRSIGAPQMHAAHTGIPIVCVPIIARSGLYTQCLERCIVIPGLETRKMFRRVGKVVLKMSDGRQHPVRACGSSTLDLLQLMSVSPLRQLSPSVTCSSSNV